MMPELCKGCLYRDCCDYDDKHCIYLSEKLVRKYNPQMEEK